MINGNNKSYYTHLFFVLSLILNLPKYIYIKVNVQQKRERNNHASAATTANTTRKGGERERERGMDRWEDR
jgi:hypothetical protein